MGIRLDFRYQWHRNLDGTGEKEKKRKHSQGLVASKEEDTHQFPAEHTYAYIDIPVPSRATNHVSHCIASHAKPHVQAFAPSQSS